jgi:pimeloyl-ACP methyl ester carboxylesterase
MNGQEMRVFKPANLLLAVSLALLLGGGQPGSPALDFTKTPVFFVHGFGMSAGIWDKMISYLQDSGYPRRYLMAVQLTPGDGSNIDAAENQIAPAVEKFLTEINQFNASNNPGISRKDKVDLVSHSMGAMSARWYAAKVRPDRVRVWLSLCGANHGSDAGCRFVGKYGPGADELCPAFAASEADSPVQFGLNGKPRTADVDETPFGIGPDAPGVETVPPDTARKILYVTIRTVDDKWIVPDESALLDGAGGAAIRIPDDLPAVERPTGNFRMENGVLHDPILWDPSALKLVGIILDATI